MDPTIINTLDAIPAKLTTAVLFQVDNAIITQHADYTTVAAYSAVAIGRPHVVRVASAR